MRGLRIGTVLLLLTWSSAARAQGEENPSTVQLSGIAGYQVTSTAYTKSGTISFDGAATYGAAVSLGVLPDEYRLEILWTISGTDARFASSVTGVPSAYPTTVTVNYFQLGVTKSLRTGIFESFGEATAGLVLLSPDIMRLTSGDTLSVSSTVQFAFTLAAGFRIVLLEQLAVLFEARLLVPVYFTGGGFFAGGGGAVLVVGAGIPCVQGAFSGGLLLRL
ncbi:MAG TPA: hypothetical protein VEJ89_06465 [Myxococcaceae bacterium]|nr:hypothetical protein [Myxococcaceae bacterium]